MTGVGSAFSQEWIIYERVGGARPLSSRTTDLTRALRAALLEQHGRRDLSPVLSGHRGESAPSDAVHLAFVALPWLGHEHADASIQGCAIVSPRSLSSADRETLYGLIAAWERERTVDDNGTMELAHATLPPVRVRRVEIPTKLTNRTMTWCRPARLFATATPIALDRYPGNLRSNQQRTSQRAAAEAAESIARSCERIGLPTPVSVEVSLAPVMQGSQPVHAFASWPSHRDRPQRARVHAVIEFGVHVHGPVLLGAGRYFGLGLCAPIGGFA